MRGKQTDQPSARVPGTRPNGERPSGARQGGLRAAGVVAAGVAAPIVARRSGILARLKAEWRAIAGEELAAATWPMALARDGALKLRVSPGIALELQHRAPLVIERINLFFGHQPVVRLVLVQGTLPLTAVPVAAPPAMPSAGEAAALDLRLADVADPELRVALARLGRLVLGRTGRDRR